MGKTYAFSDLHGDYELWKKIQNFLKEEDCAFCLGDCCDRGNYGIKIMQEILNDSRIVYLQGNHERMFLNGIACREPHVRSIFGMKDYTLWMQNGGLPTADAYYKLDFDEQTVLYDKIYDLNYCTIYINLKKQIIFLSHAGCQPWQATLNPHTEDKYDLLWNRDHISLEWSEKDEYKNLYIVHGHTPVQYITQSMENPEVIQYCQKHKIDIDLGTFNSGKAALLDLDTFEVIYFQKEGKDEN